MYKRTSSQGLSCQSIAAFRGRIDQYGPALEECRKNLIGLGSEGSPRLDRIDGEKDFQALLERASLYHTRDGTASRVYHDFLFDSFEGDKYRICSREEADRPCVG
jgi:hypothetical protein